jgi:hypothetical protein
MITRASLVPNLGCEIKQTRTRTQHVRNKNPSRFYCKKEKEKKDMTRKCTQN